MDKQKFTKEEEEDFVQRMGGDISFIVEEGVEESFPCLTRRCFYLTGTVNEDGVPICAAFPLGIPDEIVEGRDDHIEPFSGDHGIQYKKEVE